MVPKSRKLATADFKTLRGASFFSSEHLTLRVKPVSAGGTRFAVVAATAVDARAVARNRMRRQIFSLLEAVPLSGAPALVVVGVRKKFERRDRDRIREELYSLARRARGRQETRAF